VWIFGIFPLPTSAIYLYTQQTPLYGELNRALRSENRQAITPYFLYLKLLLTAVKKLPKWSGTVYREIKLAVNQLGDSYAKGEEFIWWGFSSCATTLTVLADPQYLGAEGNRTLFALKVSSADREGVVCFPH
jgi:hypothetical protein